VAKLNVIVLHSKDQLYFGGCYQKAINYFTGTAQYAVLHYLNVQWFVHFINTCESYSIFIQRTSEAPFQPGMLARFTGRFLDVSKCEVNWSHHDKQTVGGTTVVKLKVHVTQCQISNYINACYNFTM